MNSRILHLDIENTPSLGYYFDLWKEGNIVREKEGWHILSIAWKWEHERGYHVRALCDYPGYKQNKKNDKALVHDIWKLLDAADIVVAHNGDRFDVKKINSRFLFHRLKPTSPFKTVDTLKILRAKFAENSNRLDAFARAHGLGRKLPHHGFSLWEECMEGNAKAWATMKRYNVHDVRLLVKTYKLILPWITNHPWVNKAGCPNCGEAKLVKNGTHRNKASLRQRLHCMGCGAWSLGEKL